MGVYDRDAAARRRFIDAILAGCNVTEAARAAGIDRRTPYQWRKRGDAEVAVALELATGRGGQGRPRSAAILALPPEVQLEVLKRLRAILTDDTAPVGAQIEAAALALDLYRRTQGHTPGGRA